MESTMNSYINSDEILRLIPAYGTLLYDANHIIEAWEKEVDFKIIRGSYISIRDIEKIKEDGYKVIEFYSYQFKLAVKLLLNEEMKYEVVL